MTDVFIVGGGPAGLATAIALRARGLGVTVADPARPPIDKSCGEGLMPGAVAALERLGVRLPSRHCFPFRGIRFLGADTSVDASFPNGTGVGIRRTHLHQSLIDRANEVGVDLRWATAVRSLSATGVVLDGEAVDCRWVIGADGENSRVRRWAGLERALWSGVGIRRKESLRYGFRRHYRIAPWTDCVEIFWGSGCQLYVTPIGPEEIGVAAITRDSHLRLDQIAPMFPDLFARLKDAAATSTERGAVSSTRRLANVYRDRVILVGDASGSVDAITGEGLQLAFEQALALADSLAEDNLSGYASAHRHLTRRPTFMAALLLQLDRFAWLRRRALRALASEPGMFAAQVAMHVGAGTTSGFVRRSLLPLGLRILTA